MKLFFLSFILSCICMLTVTAQEVGSIVSASKLQGGMPVADRGSVATIIVDTLDYEVVKIAANDLRKDIVNVTNVVPKIANIMVDGPQIVIGTLGHSKFVYELVKYSHLDVSRLQNQWEKFLIQVIDSPKNPGKKILAIIGSDRRGTAYGVYELSRQIGVSPWYWWADVPVKKSKSLFVKPGCYIFGTPSVKYRGIFINDEEQGFGPWARKVYDPETKTIGPKTYARVYELMLRLKANLLWPAMKGPESFYSVPGNKEMADKYAIIIGTSHHEPLLFASSLEWKAKRDGRWQYDVNAETIKKVMEKRVAEAAQYENIYTIGLRGQSDLGMEAEGGMDDRINLMQKIFADQRIILQKYINRPIDNIPQAFTAYKEVLDLVNNGLKVPDDAILVWPDDNYGYIQQLNSDIQKKRPGGSGIYYHLNYVGRPFSTQWLSAPSPELIRKELNRAYGNGATKLWMFNVGDIKPYEFLISYCLNMAWHFSYNDTSLTRNYMDKWLNDTFSAKFVTEISSLLRGYYQSSFERKPEFMGWTRSEPSTPVVNTEYSMSNYSEAQRRLSTLGILSDQTKNLWKDIPPQLKSGFFEMVYYPIVCADLMNKKMLYAQMNRTYARDNRVSANYYADLSRRAQESLDFLTRQFGEIENGKWKSIMNLQSGAPSQIPPLETVIPMKEACMGIDYSGKNILKGTNQTSELPYFNKFYNEKYEIVIYNKGQKSFNWEATTVQPWIQISRNSGSCSLEERIQVSIDWKQVPSAELNNGNIIIKGAGNIVNIGVHVFNPTISADSLKNRFVEQNGAISIYARNFSRKIDKGPYKWTTLNDIGLTNKLMAITNDTLSQVNFEWNLAKNAPYLEYGFYTYNQGWMDIYSYTLPTHAISLQRGSMYGISVDNQPPKIMDFSTRNRNEEWQVNVMRNAAIQVSRHFIDKPGRHTLKIWLIDTDVCFDKFIIDTGGLKQSYTGPPETKL